MTIKPFFLSVALLIPTISLADRWVPMPGGGGCMIGNSGVAYGCSGIQSSDEARAERETERTNRKKLDMLEKCLRTSDWPGQPSRSECQAMYGQ